VANWPLFGLVAFLLVFVLTLDRDILCVLPAALTLERICVFSVLGKTITILDDFGSSGPSVHIASRFLNWHLPIMYLVSLSPKRGRNELDPPNTAGGISLYTVPLRKYY
jgi:hypothetical protein